jgi:hypothetical protein
MRQTPVPAGEARFALPVESVYEDPASLSDLGVEAGTESGES